MPGNLLDLYVPEVAGGASLPLLIWHSGSGWYANDIKGAGDQAAAVDAFTARGYAVASINIRSSADARFPAQAFDIRAAIRYLRDSAPTYGIDPERFAFMGTSTGGWATAFAAMTGDTLQLEGETGVNGTSSAVRVAVAFFPPTDFLSMDAFAAAMALPTGDQYPHDRAISAESYLIQCPGEGAAIGPRDATALKSIQACPEQTEEADPTTYIDGAEIPIWLLHGLADPVVPYNQSQLVYDAATAEGNEARLTLVPGAGHWVEDVIEAPDATTWTTDVAGDETKAVGTGPTWEDIFRFVAAHL